MEKFNKNKLTKEDSGAASTSLIFRSSFPLTENHYSRFGIITAIFYKEEEEKIGVYDFNFLITEKKKRSLLWAMH